MVVGTIIFIIMPVYQAYNKRIKAWIKYKSTSKGSRTVNVKEREPMKKFKGVPVKGKKK